MTHTAAPAGRIAHADHDAARRRFIVNIYSAPGNTHVARKTFTDVRAARRWIDRMGAEQPHPFIAAV